MNTEEKFILGALVGSALGAAAALIFTPMAGRNLRSKLMNGLTQTPQRKPRPRAHPAEHKMKKPRAKKKADALT